MNEIPASLQTEMEKYAINIAQMNLDQTIIEARLVISNIMASLEAAQDALTKAEESYQALAKKLEASIRIRVLELGASASHEGVEAKYRSGYTSETYPVKDVRKILLANPAILPAFNAISVTKEIAPSVSISYKAPENAPKV